MKLTLHSNLVQILHIRTNHWIVISNLQSEATCISVLDVYDMTHDQVDDMTRKIITSIFEENLQSNPVKDFQKQNDVTDCGIFAIAVATSLLHNIPVKRLKFNQASL